MLTNCFKSLDIRSTKGRLSLIIFIDIYFTVELKSVTFELVLSTKLFSVISLYSMDATIPPPTKKEDSCQVTCKCYFFFSCDFFLFCDIFNRIENTEMHRMRTTFLKVLASRSCRVAVLVVLPLLQQRRLLSPSLPSRLRARRVR